MSLLRKLVQLHRASVPLENFFTEVVGHLLLAHPALCRLWLSNVGLVEVRGERRVVGVKTQPNLAALEHHREASRPDIEIELSDGVTGARPDVIFVESKVASGEGSGQLRRYAEQLAALGRAGRRTLLYVTRDYDPKDPEAIIDGVGGSQKTVEVRFVQSRWSDFYRSLAEYQTSLQGAGSELIAEVMTFMEEQGMARAHRLSGMEIEAISRLHRVLSIMEETCADATAQLRQFAGRRPKQWGVNLGTLRWGFYTPLCALGADESWYCGFGYVMSPEYIKDWVGSAQSDYPAIRAVLQMPPETIDRAERVVAMQEIAKQWEEWGWKIENIERTDKWSGITRTKSLAAILSEEDHVAAIRAFFLESVAHFEAFRIEHPHLPWGATQ